MAIRFHPAEFVKKTMPKNAIKKLVKKNLTLNRTAVNVLTRSGILKKSAIEEIAIKVIRDYRDRYGDEREAGIPKAEALEDTLNDKKQMVQRVQNSAVHQVAKEIKAAYRGELYTWLPSSANVPDPLHQLNYGRVFRLGRGEMPGDRYGCQCGMQIHVADDQLDI